jgi:hypothetical protein
MKKWLIPSALFLASIAVAQNPLLEDTKTWSCYGDYFFLNVKYQLGGDTLMNGKTFRKVLAHGSSVPFNFHPDSSQYKSALREQDGKVWVVEKGFITEHLLYNFTKNTGDTIRFYRPIGDFNQGVLPQYVVGKVYKTNTVILNGISRKRLYIHDPYMVDMLPAQALSQLDPQADVWIEGIGSKTGLFSRMPEWGVVGPQPYLLTCVDLNGSSLYAFNSGYPASSQDPCFIIPPDGSGSGSTGGGGTGGSDSLILHLSQSLPSSILLFPNPAKDQLTLSPVKNMRSTVTVYKSDGSFIYAFEKRPVDLMLKLYVSALPAGLYRIRLQQGETNNWLRFVKE